MIESKRGYLVLDTDPFWANIVDRSARNGGIKVDHNLAGSVDNLIGLAQQNWRLIFMDTDRALSDQQYPLESLARWPFDLDEYGQPTFERNPILLVSNRFSRAQWDQAKALGAVHYATKVNHVGLVDEMIRVALSESRRRREEAMVLRVERKAAEAANLIELPIVNSETEKLSA